MRLRAASLGLAALLPTLGGCTSLVGYTNDLVDSKSGRTWFVRAPAGIGGTLGFVLGIPVDVVASPVSWAIYRSQPKETHNRADARATRRA